jgi:hypothetical protein
MEKIDMLRRSIDRLMIACWPELQWKKNGAAFDQCLWQQFPGGRKSLT